MTWDADALSAFFDSDMPGYAEATLAGGTPVDGLFGKRYAEAFGAVSGDGPAYTGKSSDLSGLVRGDAITIGGTAYTVRTPQPTGTGITVLALEES